MRNDARVLLALLVAGGCGILESGADRRGELAAAQARWAAHDLSTYEYRYTRQCGECLPEWSRSHDVRVEDGTVVRVRDAQTGAAPPEGYTVLTVPDLFALIEDAIGSAAFLSVEYDREYGHPTRVSLDYSREIADDEFTIRVADLRPAS